jgi:hypothetical protein
VAPWAPGDPKAAERRKNAEQGRRLLGYVLTGTLSLCLVIGVGKIYFVWRGWRIDYNRERRPWEKVS